MCLSIKCNRRFCGVEHFLSQFSTKHPYYISELATAGGERGRGESLAYSLVSAGSPRSSERVMVLLDVQIEQMTRGEVLAALRTAIHMRLKVMDLVIFIGRERERLAVRR
jgi:hypothetical protein